MHQDASPQPPKMGERGINIGQPGGLTVTHTLDTAYTDGDKDLTKITLLIDGAATGPDDIEAHVDVEADGPKVEVTLLLDTSALDVLDGAVRAAYREHRHYVDQQPVTR